MTKKEMNELADMIVDKLLTTYIRENIESELLGDLAKLLTKLEYHKEKEEYELCAELQKEINIVNDKLSKL